MPTRGAIPRRRGPACHGSTVVDEPVLGRIATADGLFVTDSRQRIVCWSSAAQRLLGYAPEEVVGHPCFLVLMGREPDGHPVCRRECPVMRNARHGRGTAAYEVTARARDGSLRYLSNSVVVLQDAPGAFRVMHLLREARAVPAGDPIEQGRRPAPPDDGVGAAPERPPIVESLTRRELEVLRMASLAATTDEIAAALSISIFTARNHIASVQRKLGARSRLEMVLLGMRGGLI